MSTATLILAVGGVAVAGFIAGAMAFALAVWIIGRGE